MKILENEYLSDMPADTPTNQEDIYVHSVPCEWYVSEGNMDDATFHLPSNP